jgi:hypothetical protein
MALSGSSPSGIRAEAAHDLTCVAVGQAEAMCSRHGPSREGTCCGCSTFQNPKTPFNRFEIKGKRSGRQSSANSVTYLSQLEPDPIRTNREEGKFIPEKKWLSAPKVLSSCYNTMSRRLPCGFVGIKHWFTQAFRRNLHGRPRSSAP